MVSEKGLDDADVAANVIEVFKECLLTLPEEEITVETKLEDVVQDSFEVIEVVFALEEKFDVSIDNDEIQNVKTVADLVERFEALVESRKSAPSAAG